MKMTFSVLDAVAQACRDRLGLQPVMAAELEFYLSGRGDIDGFAALMERACQGQGIETFALEKERGEGQYEYALRHRGDPVRVARDAEALKRLIAQAAQKSLFTADFRAKPSHAQPGSGLHVHVSLWDGERNVFTRDGDAYSEALRHAVGGMLHHLPASMAHFAPHPESYARFVKDGFNVPTTVSWGANNRTVAVRLPDGPAGSKHIEHRVAGADADVAEAMAAVLAAALDGVKRGLEPNEKMYGNAHDAQYHRPRLPASLEEAQALSHGSPLREFAP